MSGTSMSSGVEKSSQSEEVAERYLDLLKKCLTRSIFFESYRVVEPPRGSLKGIAWLPVRALLRRRHYQVIQRLPDHARLREEGRDWPAQAETMVGLRRLENVQSCIRQILREDVQGDLIECGVWRGGTTIFMKACLTAYGDGKGRRVWVADSFQGLPKPDPGAYPADAGLDLWRWSQLTVSVDEVRANFAKYGLLDENVRFLEGWLKDTLPSAPIEHLALLRIDVDMYESTMDALRWLYSKVSPGGYVIVDDYGAIPACRQAINDFRAAHGIREPLNTVDWTAVYWRKKNS